MKKHSENRSGKKSKHKRARKRDKAIAKLERALDAAPVGPIPSIVEHESDLMPMLEGYDASGLSRAKAHWFFGEWGALGGLDLHALRHHPDRDRFALLVAAAQQQLGEHDGARKSVRVALEWGCSPRLVAQIMTAGVHNSLGRASALAGHEERTKRHFRSSIEVSGTSNGPADLLSHMRAVREMTTLGLLPQAAAVLGEEIAEAADKKTRPEHADARLKILQTELELLRGGLVLAARRAQLYSQDDTAAAKQVATAEPTPARAGLDHVSTSQLGQDLWVLEMTGHKREGFFVEFGACDGILLSNTYLLEREFGWNGICAEPNPGFFPELRKNRRCTVSDACIGGESGLEVEFVLADEFGGMEAHASADSHADKRQAYRDLGRTIRLSTVSLHDFLVANQAPREIDYLSIDTEGSEYEILRTFPFDQWRVRCITVEHNYTDNREPIRLLLESHGYRRVEAQWDDWYLLD